jgi:hypothetical protein
MSNLIDKYRAVQRRIRAYFEAYTPEICPSCPDFCCRKPTKVGEFDVLLANACGCSLPSADIASAELVEAGFRILKGLGCEDSFEPCDYLDTDGCVFPPDLRPYECVRYICPFLKRRLSSAEMREVRTLLHRMSVIHRDLLETVHPGRRRRKN